MSNKICSAITVHVEKVGSEWIVELYFPGYDGDPVWIARDRSKMKAISKAQDKLNRASNRLYDFEFGRVKTKA